NTNALTKAQTARAAIIRPPWAVTTTRLIGRVAPKAIGPVSASGSASATALTIKSDVTTREIQAQTPDPRPLSYSLGDKKRFRWPPTSPMTISSAEAFQRLRRRAEGPRPQ